MFILYGIIEHLKKMNIIDTLESWSSVILRVGTSLTVKVLFWTTVLSTTGVALIIGLLAIITAKTGIYIPLPNYIATGIIILILGALAKHMYVFTPKNNMRILVSLIPDFGGVREINSTKDIKSPKKQIPVGEGISLKAPWYRNDGDDGLVSLVKTVPINIITSTQSKDDKVVEVEVIAALSAIPGKDVVWYKRADEDAAKKMYEARLEIETQKIIRRTKSSVIIKDPVTTFSKLEKLFGKEAISDTERRTGRILSNVGVKSAELDSPTQRLDEAKANAQKIADILDTVLPSCNGNQILEQTIGARAVDAINNNQASTINVQQVKGKGGKNP
jgi:hypothetical protein